MNEEQISRLEELQKKSQEGLSEVEIKELAELTALDADAKVAEEKEQPKVEVEEQKDAETLNEEEAKALVTESVKEANEEIKEAIEKVSEKTVSQEDIAEAISKSILEKSSNSLTPDKVQEIVEESLQNTNQGLSEEAVKKLINTTISGLKGESKMKHEAADAERVSIPVGERKGNLPVNQKQLLNVMKGLHIDEDIPESVLADAKSAGHRNISAIREGRKDLTSIAAGAGAELTPTDLSSALQERLYLESAVAASFASVEVNMPSDPFKIPVSTVRPAFVKLADNAAASADTTQATTEVTLDAEKLMSYVQYSYELDEDSIVAVLPMITAQLSAAAAEAFEDAIINGQQGGAIDNGVTAANSITDGLRKLAEGVAGVQYNVNGPVTTSDLVGARKLMGKFGMRPSDTIIISGYKAYNDIVALAEVATLDKIGGAASVLSGAVPQIYGMDVIPSSSLSDAVHTDGKVSATGSENIKGQFIMVHKPSFVVGVRGGFQVETDRNITTQSNQVVASFRRDFQPLEALSASVTPVAWGQNIT
jgi:HK97 family phage major capsid protein